MSHQVLWLDALQHRLDVRGSVLQVLNTHDALQHRVDCEIESENDDKNR